MSDFRDAAESCAALGWSVVPMILKKARVKWRNPPPWDSLGPLWDDPTTTGLAVILGEPSGNLAVRDFDRIESYERWRYENQELAAILPTAETPRPGRHVFVRTETTCKTSRYDDGEMRGKGAYVVLPPSLHESGKRYRWIIDPYRDIPLVDPSILVGGAKLKSQSLPEPRRRSDIGEREVQEGCLTHARAFRKTIANPHIACGKPGYESFINRAINKTLPTKFGQRNHRIFDFARHLLAVLDRTTDHQPLHSYVERWYIAALPYIRTKDFEETWCDFLYAWENVKSPSQQLLQTIKDLAADDTFTLGTGDTNVDRVVRVFRAAARVHGSASDFYMDFRTLGECAGLSHVTAHKNAQGLVAGKLLKIVQKGTVGRRGRATVWRWLGPLD